MSNSKATSEFIESKKKELRRTIDRNKDRKRLAESSVESFIGDWVTVANEIGINGETVDLLYDGFKFAAAAPIHRFALKSKSEGAYARLFSEKRSMDNAGGEAVALGLNLLALEIREPSVAGALDTIAEKLPQLAAKGSKQSVSVIKRSLENLLIAPLSTVRFGAIARIGNARRLYLLLKNPLEGFIDDPNKKSGSVNTAKALLGWLAANAGEASSITSAAETSAISTEEPENERGKGIDGVAGFSDEYKLEHENLKRSVQQLSQELKEAKANADESKTKLAECNSRLEDAQTRITELGTELAKSQDSLKSSASELSTLKHDLGEARLMLDTTAERDKHKEDAATKRMAQKLSIEYRDFLDALDEPMDVELGEMLRDQLRTVFDILKSFGVNL